MISDDLFTPSYEEFLKKSKKGNLIPVYVEILADLETPVSAFLKLDESSGYSFLLESVEGGEKWGRYSFLGISPVVIFRSKGNRVEIIRNGAVQEEIVKKDPLETLKKLISTYTPVESKELPRFYGGAVGYLSYDIVRFFEKLPDDTTDDLNLYDSFFMITDTIVVFDNIAQKMKIVSNAFLENGKPREVYEQAKEKIKDILERLHQPLQEKEQKTLKNTTYSSSFSKEDFKKAVRKTKEYIKAGDIIQAVLAQRLCTEIECDPFDIYRALRTINPSPYLYYLKFGNLKIVGSSPEVMVRYEDGKVELRPIAGTRPRGKTEEEDQKLMKELLSDPKERAEHVMLVDLGRNDLGRVSRMGTVEVNEFMVIEKYSHVMHIVSNVRGNLNKNKDSFDVIRACFPAGTVSGAPKIRAMEIIEEMEPTKRGPYAGAIGYFGFSGNMETCITIRTAVISGKTLYLGVGAGIVADSKPEKEYQETMNKAKAILTAVEKAHRGLR
jgi:anthranilate synthase component 1